jgi:hypothetical protein
MGFSFTMDCLTNYIGLRNCGLPTPGSNLYVNSLPGMSTELADKIANSEQTNFIGVWEDVQLRSIMRLKDDIINTMFEYVKFNETVYQTRKLLKSQPAELIPIAAANEYRGAYFMLPEGKYSEYRLNELYIYSYQTVTTTLKAWDVNDGSELYSQSIDLVPGLNTITEIGQVFNLRYRLLELFIGVDCSGVTTIQTLNDLYYWYDTDWACAAQSQFGYGGIRGVFQIFPATYDPNLPLTLGNLNRTGIGKGVVIGAEIGCSIDQFICDNKKKLEQPLLYLLGSETLFQKLGSPRLNYWSSSNLEQTDALRAEFEKRYFSNLKRVLNAIPLVGESVCFNCEEVAQVQTKGMLP